MYSRQEHPNKVPTLEETIMKLGGLGFSPIDVAICTGTDPDEVRSQFVAQRGHIYELYHQGRILTEAKIREAVITKAAGGDSESIIIAINYFKQADRDTYLAAD